jgi:Immunity protein 26
MDKIQKRVVGDIVKISLGDGFHTYARVLDEALFTFYDSHTKEEMPILEIITLPILFQIAVMDYAVKRGRWVIVGNAPLDDPRLKQRPQFMQDILRKEQFSIYEKGGKIRPAVKEECIGLERAAVWEPTHVEDRLRDHYAGQKNKWVESLKIKE